MIQSPLDAALYTKLTGGTALTSLLASATAVFNWLGPENTDPPYVVFNSQSDVPVYTLSGVAYENTIYTVKGVTLGPSAAAAGAIATQIDLALNDQTLTISGYTQMYMRREQAIDYPEVVAGQRYHHRGAMYRIIAR